MAVNTDLHTHLAGVLSSSELIQFGLEHNASLDAPTAKRLQIVNANYSGGPIPLSTMSEKDLEKLKAGLELDPAKKSLFDSLDEVYANRAFLTKNPALFVPLLEKIAHSYEEQGVSYAELSYAGVISNPNLLKDIHENMPRIEKETGVKLRFLGAMWRHSDAEWNMDEADRLKMVLKSPYVAGIDVMGHEKNPIRELKEPLQEVVKYAAENIPGCVVRLHAGENPYYSADPSSINDYNFNNAYESVKIVDDARRNPDGTLIEGQGKDLQVRIGHGRYGLQPETLKLIADTGTISELCLSSNYLLNHADSFHGPFNLYADHGISFVLGSDGYGMYNTTLPNEYAMAVKGGMTADARKVLAKTEEDVIAKDAERFDKKMAAWKQFEQECAARGSDPYQEMSQTVFSTPDGRPRWNDGIGQAKRDADEQKRGQLMGALEGMGVNTDADAITHLLDEHKVYLFSGASMTSWKKIPEDQQERVVKTMRDFIDSLDGRRDMVVTGGTDYGFEAVIHRLVEERNKTLPSDRQIPVVGAFTLEANPKEVRQGTLSHAMVIKYGDGLAHSWMDQSPALMDMVTRTDAKVIMAGGGQVIRDMIVDADGRGLMDGGNVLLFAGVNGASAEKAPEYPANSFASSDELFKRLSGAGVPKTQTPAPQPRPMAVG